MGDMSGTSDQDSTSISRCSRYSLLIRTVSGCALSCWNGNECDQDRLKHLTDIPTVFNCSFMITNCILKLPRDTSHDTHQVGAIQWPLLLDAGKTGTRQRGQRYSIVSDSSLDYFAPIGDDFTNELVSEHWQPPGLRLLACSRWHTVVVLMVYSRSFSHCLHCCSKSVSKVLPTIYGI